MTAPDRRRRRAAEVLATVPVVVAAALLWHHLPDSTQVQGPFDVHGRLGSTVSGRALTVLVNGVQISPRAHGASRWGEAPPVAATGRWVVIDAQVSAAAAPVLPRVDLRIGPNTYGPSDRFLGYTLGGSVDPGMAQHGFWVFDVAPELVESAVAAPFELRVWSGLDNRLDNRLVVDLGGRAPNPTGSVTLSRPEAAG